MTETKKLTIRIALREEGHFWNAYLAKSDTMADAMLIGSILIAPARANPEIKAAFIAVMQQVLADAVEQVTGHAVEEWFTESAPEAERSGHG